MVCRGNSEIPSKPAIWPLVTFLNILGHYIMHDGGLREDWQLMRTHMWGAFWKNCAGAKASSLAPLLKIRLLYRSVLAKIEWKLSRWPFQKSIALELDALQSRMCSFLLPCEKLPTDDIDSYCRRRHRNANSLCNDVGLWSLVWCHRVVAWHDHIHRAVNYNHICRPLLNFQDSIWLQFKRSEWVSETLGHAQRNNSLAGRTGTRMNCGRPQTRWHDGLKLAKATSIERSEPLKGKAPLSIGTRIGNALSSLKHRC